MTIPIEIIVAFLVAIIALQGWILAEVVALKVRLANYEELNKRVTHLEHRAKRRDEESTTT